LTLVRVAPIDQTRSRWCRRGGSRTSCRCSPAGSSAARSCCRPGTAREAGVKDEEQVQAGGTHLQFLGESILLALIGGIVGVLAGAIATVIYASSKNWHIVIPVEAWTGGIAAAILIGASAGVLTAVRASRLPPTVALRTV
jgi:hypothetical protein